MDDVHNTKSRISLQVIVVIDGIVTFLLTFDVLKSTFMARDHADRKLMWITRKWFVCRGWQYCQSDDNRPPPTRQGCSRARHVTQGGSRGVETRGKRSSIHPPFLSMINEYAVGVAGVKLRRLVCTSAPR